MSLLKHPNICEDFSPTSEIVLHHGDTIDLLKQVPDKTFRLIITSPPYNPGKETAISEEEELIKISKDSLCIQ